MSFFGDLLQVQRELTPMLCPGCGGDERRHIWRYDRYFLDVDLSACLGCGLVYLARGLEGKAADRFYGNVYPRLMRWPRNPRELETGRENGLYRRKVVSAIVGPIDDLLEVGSGFGFFLDACRAEGARVHGLEPGPPQREYAVDELGLGAHVSAEPLTPRIALPFVPKVIAMFHVLEHLDDPGAALALLAERIDPRGWLVIEVPDILADWRSLGLMQIHVSHRSYFSARTLAALLLNNGFTPCAVQQEPAGIYAGNLRMFARPSSLLPATGSVVPDALDDRPPTAQQTARLATQIVSQIRPLSLANGFPRAAWRLLRIAAD